MKIRIDDTETELFWIIEIEEGEVEEFINFINSHPDGIASVYEE
jgi:hypothetical protein